MKDIIGGINDARITMHRGKAIRVYRNLKVKMNIRSNKARKVSRRKTAFVFCLLMKKLSTPTRENMVNREDEYLSEKKACFV
jgi:hypothetical protein